MGKIVKFQKIIDYFSKEYDFNTCESVPLEGYLGKYKCNSI